MLHQISTRQKVIVMLAVMSGLFLVALDQTIIATALGAIVKEFNSFTSLGFVVTAYLLTSTVTVPIAGKLSDMYGRRVILLSGVIIFALGSLLGGLAPNVEMLIAWRALQGIGGGIIMANAFTIVGDLFTPKERGKWQGMIGAVFGMSSVIGPLLGGWLTDNQHILGMVTNWRWTFLINVPIGIVSAIVIARYCPNIKHDNKHYPDYIGAAFIALALSSLVLAVDNTDVIFSSLINNGVELYLIKTVLFSVAIIAGAIFVWVERKAKQPIIPLRFFKNRTFSLMSLVALLFGAGFLGAILYLTQFNQQVYGATASSAGLMLLPMVGGMMVSSIGAGQLISRIGRYKPFIVTGFTLASLSILSLITLNPDSPYIQEAIIMAFAGLGLGMAMPVLNLAVQNEFEQHDLGASTASVQLFRGLGSTIGTALLSGVLTSGIIASIGTPTNIPYIKSLQQSPAAARLFSGDIDADKLLIINAQKATIKKEAEKAVNALPVPESVKQSQLKEITRQQDDFSSKVTKAFTDSLHQVFGIASVMMVSALAAVVFVKDKKLRDTHAITFSE